VNFSSLTPCSSRAGKSNPPVIEVAYRIDDSPRLTYNAKLAFQSRQPGAPVFFPYIVKVSSGQLPGRFHFF